MGKDNWTPTKYSRVCSEHFLETDYIGKRGLVANLLEPNAVPRIFPVSYREIKQKVSGKIINLKTICSE